MTVRRSGEFKDAAARVENGVKRGLILAGDLVAQRATNRAPRDTGRLKRSITRGDPYLTGPQRWAIDVGTNVIYAAAQEFGYIGTVTERQRAFFWHMYAETGEGMWRALALSKQYVIPMRPYLRPAVWLSGPDISRLILRSVLGAIRAKD